MSDNLSNIHRAVNIISISEKELKKYQIVKVGNSFLKDDILNLYDNEFVKILNNSQLLKYKVTKDNIVYRKK